MVLHGKRGGTLAMSHSRQCSMQPASKNFTPVTSRRDPRWPWASFLSSSLDLWLVNSSSGCSSLYFLFVTLSITLVPDCHWAFDQQNNMKIQQVWCFWGSFSKTGVPVCLASLPSHLATLHRQQLYPTSGTLWCALNVAWAGSYPDDIRQSNDSKGD